MLEGSLTNLLESGNEIIVHLCITSSDYNKHSQNVRNLPYEDTNYAKLYIFLCKNLFLGKLTKESTASAIKIMCISKSKTDSNSVKKCNLLKV